MAYSLWEFLTFTPEQLRERERTLSFEEREQQRLEAASRKSAVDFPERNPRNVISTK